MSGLSERAMLVSVNISIWSIAREDKKRAEEIANKYGAAGKMGKYQRYLIDPDAIDPIRKAAGELRREHYDLTLPWGDDGARIIATAGFLQYRERMQGRIDSLTPLFDQFERDYPKLVNDAQYLLNGLWSPAEYPASHLIRGYFKARIKFRPVPDADDFRAELSADDVEAIRQQIRSEVPELEQVATGEAMGRVRAALEHMAERLKGYQKVDVQRPCRPCNGTGQAGADSVVQGPCSECAGKGWKWGKGTENGFKDSLVENVKDLVSALPGLNITGSQAIDEIAREIDRELTRYSAETLRTDETRRERTAARAEEILAKMTEYGL